MIRFRSPVHEPLRRKRAAGVPRPPDAGSAFYVTQQFADIDWYWSQRGITRTHDAVDIGNARCGSPIVAMTDGTILNVKDNATAFGAPSDALGVIQDTGRHGVNLEYWHLGSYGVANGARVVAGQTIGTVGATGLGSVCHCHIVMKINGVRVDPEPYIFGATYGAQVDERDDMPEFGGADFQHSDASYRTLAGARFRSTPELDGAILATFPAGIMVRSHAIVEGEAVDGNDKWAAAWLYAAGKYRWGVLHTSTLTLVTPIPLTPNPAAAIIEQIRKLVN